MLKYESRTESKFHFAYVRDALAVATTTWFRLILERKVKSGPCRMRLTNRMKVSEFPMR